MAKMAVKSGANICSPLTRTAGSQQGIFVSKLRLLKGISTQEIKYIWFSPIFRYVSH